MIVLLLLVLCVRNSSAQIIIEKYLKNGRVYLYNEEYSNAIRAFNVILNYDEDNADALFYRGFCKLQLSDYTGAVSDFTRTISSDRFYTAALYYRAVARMELNNFTHALKDLIQAIDIDDRHDYYFVARGYLHTEFGDTLGAIKDYEKALVLSPKNESALLSLGQIYMHKKQYERSLEYIDKLTAFNPKNEQAFLLKGNVLQYQKEYTKAVDEYKHVIELDSNNIRALFFLGICMHDTKSYDSAYMFFNKAEKLNPDNSVLYYHRALLNIETEKYKAALNDLNEVIDLNSRNIYSYHLRGVVKIYLEDFAGAEADFSKAIELYPFMVDAYRNRAYTRGMQNKIQGYYSDQSIIDSLFKMGEEVVDDIDLNYFKSITDFNADFTNTENVSSSKLQYVDQSIRMISIYHPILLDDQELTEPYKPVNGLNFDNIGTELLMRNYYYPEIDEFTIADIKKSIDKAQQQYPDSLSFEMLKSIVLSWLMEYDYAYNIIDSIIKVGQPNYMHYFLKGNYAYFIGSVMASLEIQQFRLDQSEGINVLINDNDQTTEKFEEAIACFDKAIALNPNHLYSYYNRAYLNASLKNYGEAINDYTHCIEKSYNFADALYNRGLIRVYLNQNTLGCADLSLAGEKGVNNAYRVIYKYCKNQY